MVLFDVSKYEVPDPKNVDIDKTKYNVGIFIGAYLRARSRVGQPREPKVTSSFSLIPPSTVGDNQGEAEQILIQNEEAQEEFNYLHGLFIKGYTSIQHPFKPDVSLRRKRIFYDRFISGHTIYVTAQRNSVSEDSVKQESSVIIVQFASALELVSFK
jgi:ArpU family phage transcriptional regulator